MHLSVCCLKSIGGNPIEQEVLEKGIPFSNLEARNLRDTSAFRRLLELIRSERIDLIHAHLTYASIWGALASRLTGIPMLATLHVAPSPEPPWTRSRIREWLMCATLNQWSAGVIAVSAAQRDAYVQAGRIDPVKLRVVHNGIDVQAFASPRGDEQDAVRREFGFPSGALVIVTVAVLRDARKGIHVLLQAARGVIEEVPEAYFLIIGDGRLKPELQAQAEAEGVAGHVRWAGFRRDVPALLAGSDLFVLPSLEESFPTVIMEAMAAGVPPVSTCADGIPEIIDSPSTGRLVEPGNWAALQGAIVDLLRHPETLAQIGTAAQQRAHETFSTEAWVRRVSEIYSEILPGIGGNLANESSST
jgi:glycosyltransferase involved in cell wall biosynthesis